MNTPETLEHGPLRISFPIVKTDPSRREVWGFATTEDLDQQGEIVDYEASKKAFGEWSEMMSRATGGKSLGNVREMHGPKAVGRVVSWHPDDKRKGIWVGAKLSESEDGEDAWRKVQEGVLNGFSIGAPVAERMLEVTPEGSRRRVVGYKLSELSLVDNPACPGSFFQEVKLMKSVGVSTMLLSDALTWMELNAEPRGVDKAAPWAPKTDDQREWVSGKIKLLVGEGKPQAQAVAQAHSMGRDKFEGKAAMVPHKEDEMDAKVLAAQAEEVAKAGKKIGPTVRTAADPPGAQKPKVEHLEAPDAPPKPAKAAEAGGGVPGDTGGDSVSAPATQGKAADANTEAPPNGVIAPEHIDIPMPPARKEGDADMGPTSMQPMVPNVPARYGYCAVCGAKQAAAGAQPFHPACEAQAKEAAVTSAAAQKLAASADFGGMAKLFRAQADAIEKFSTKINGLAAENEALKKRVQVIEDQPMPGGPHKTELPEGVRSVEKSAGGKLGSDAALALSLEKAYAEAKDPFVRDQLSRVMASGLIKSAQAGR